ncbi:DUF2281 domain-containing protein [Nostoc sp. FACHB-152]|uniref:DUF2281 domain-containing protein n=1 Tax=unclassified Nostoc TaxID=2593658 RepID=UPI001686F44E|nr:MULTISPECIES: DUF2281 domain-containing protein [unclassified Nostoc]MBD2450697.1 DUF2281 domain-containing protein [Nostoc sp. FACHB-152]MBD2471909.1 DUF2281 domain-containing protein [Nostoc sp. FACHB-145]
MSIVQSVLEKLEALPLEKQQEILDFTEFLYKKFQEKNTTKSLPESDPILGLGSQPIKLGVTDAAENHDLYIYTSDS